MEVPGLALILRMFQRLASLSFSLLSLPGWLSWDVPAICGCGAGAPVWDSWLDKDKYNLIRGRNEKLGAEADISMLC